LALTGGWDNVAVADLYLTAGPWGRGAAISGGRPISVSCQDTFLVAAADGSVGGGQESSGLYHADTRYIAEYRLSVNDQPLQPLSVSRLGFWHARWELLASRRRGVGAGESSPGTVTVTLERHLGWGQMHEDVTVHQWGGAPASLLLTIHIEDDFADLFEARTQRWQRRTHLATSWDLRRGLETAYRREDFVRRHLLRFRPRVAGAGYANGELRFPLDLRPGGEWRLCLQHDLIDRPGARPGIRPCPLKNSGGWSRPAVQERRWRNTVPDLAAADLRLEGAYRRAVSDFASLRMDSPAPAHGLWVPAAGTPWFVALFGRDSLIAGLQALIVDSRLAVATLQRLGDLQAHQADPFRDAEPGKILHELRQGEWAHFATVPHSPYYGTADATPLYLLLLAELWRWTGDAEALKSLRPVAVRALEWIDRFGDLDQDGLQEYRPMAPGNYRNQSWRDAEDGILDEVGQLPPLPLATCELQAYVFAAKSSIASLFSAWGDPAVAARLEAEAAALKQLFRQRYWDGDRLALALDGDKRPLYTASSNPGHCLWAGILEPELARLCADRLMSQDIFSGWGLRTLSTLHPSFDPHSYQAGSVWPHDTVIGAAGMARYGEIEGAWRLLDGVLDAAAAFDFQLPELFSGLARDGSAHPVPYPLANRPQAWAAGSVFQATRVLLGLHPDLGAGRVYLHPELPPWCPDLRVEGVSVGGGHLHISAHRGRNGTELRRAELVGVEAEIIEGVPPWFGS
jgi:glycogen debranching enzyme